MPSPLKVVSQGGLQYLALLDRSRGTIGDKCGARLLTQRLSELFAVKSRDISVKFEADSVLELPARVFHAVFAATIPHPCVSPVMFRNKLSV